MVIAAKSGELAPAGKERFAYVEQFDGIFGRAAELLQGGAVEAGHDVSLFGCGGAIESALKGPIEARVERALALQNVGGENASRFHIDGIVEQHQGLQGSVGIGAVHGALLARGGVEGEQAGVQEAALPEGIDSAAVEVVAMAGGVFALGEIHGHQVAVRFDGLDAGTSEAIGHQAGDGQGDVAHDFGIHAEAALMRKQAIVGIALIIVGRLLPVGAAHHDGADPGAAYPNRARRLPDIRDA